MLRASSATAFDVSEQGIVPRFEEAIPRAHATVLLPKTANGQTQIRAFRGPQLGISLELVGASPISEFHEEKGYAVYLKALPELGADLIHRLTPLGTEDLFYIPARPTSEKLLYKVALDAGVKSLRVLNHQIEFIDADGAPALRMAKPYGVDKNGHRFYPEATLAGCNYSSDPALWAKAEDASIDSDNCELTLDWTGKGAEYPALLDPEWTIPSNLPAGFVFWTPQTWLLSNGDMFVAGTSSNASQAWRPSTGLWSATGTSASTSTAADGRSVRLNDGTVLAFAGKTSSGAALNAVQQYDAATGTWTSKANLPVALYRPNAVTLANGKVLVSGGGTGNGSSVYANSYLYTPSSNSWASTGAMGTARRDHALVVLDANRVMTVGGATAGVGCTSAGALNTEIYNVSAGTWSSLGAYSQNNIVSPDTLLLSNGRVLMASSICANNNTGIFNPATNTWASAGTNTTGWNLGNQGLVELSGTVYFMAMTYSNAWVNQTYNVATNTWNAGTTTSSSKQWETAAAQLPDGRAFFVDLNGTTRTTSICGDGILSPDEACDDANATSGDGCSSSCTIETGWSCARTNVLPNGDFEAPMISPYSSTTYSAGSSFGGWSVASGSVKLDSLSAIYAPANGNQCLLLNGSAAGSITQNFPTVPGHRYIWEARTINATDNTPASAYTASFSVSSGSTSTFSMKSFSPRWAGGFDHNYGSFTAGLALSTLTISSTTAGSSGLAIDNVQIYDVDDLACRPLCSNGVVDPGEQCDDGNATSGDGCSATCTLEPGSSCPRLSMVLNGDFEQPTLNTNSTTQYSAGASFGNWSVVSGIVELSNRSSSFVYPTGNQALKLNGWKGGSVSQTIATVVGRTYKWDMSYSSSDGASRSGYLQIDAGTTSTFPFTTAVASTSASWPTATGTFVANATTATITLASISAGGNGNVIDAFRIYDPTEQGCVQNCGNGYMNPGEACDDGNATSGDGCSDTCTLEPGASCSTPADIITNGSFETPALAAGASTLVSGGGTTISGWTVSANSNVSVERGVGGSVAPLGNNYVDTAGNTLGQITQSGIPTVAGQRYVWFARVSATASGPDRGAVTLNAGGGVSRTMVVSTTASSKSATSWDYVGGLFTPSASSSIDIQSLCRNAASCFYIDNVQVRALQTCACDGNAGTGTPRACTAGAPVCLNGTCVTDSPDPGC